MTGTVTQIITALGITLALTAPSVHAQTQGLAGSYLAGNQANRDNNYAEAAKYYTQALMRDPSSPFLQQNALLAFVAKGDVKRATSIARKIADGDLGSQLADLVLIADAVIKDDFATAESILREDKDRFSPLMFGLLQGWIQLGLGQMSSAAEQFDSMQEPDLMRLFGQFHKALALAVVGDFEGSDKILQGDENGNLRLNRGSLIAHAQILSQLDRKDDALEILNNAIRGTTDTSIVKLRDDIAKNGVVDYDFIINARQGVAEVFFTLASVLDGKENGRNSLIYARLAQYLRPGNSEVILLTAEILQDQEQFDLANKTFASVSPDDPMFVNAELGRANALRDADKPETAIEVLRSLARSHGEIPRVHMSLGDALRGEEQFEAATEAYSRAIEMLKNPARNHWFLFYARGITNERTNNWEQAEKDFRKALELSPDQPLVLNYLGYSMVEMKINLEEAEQMIRKAVAARSSDGFITDSLGWVLYSVGKFDAAVAPMERAVELVSDDPIINDHLGDVYWMVGRTREAEFQWRRALSFKPEEKDAARIRRKMDIGLTEVLAEEKSLKNAD